MRQPAKTLAMFEDSEAKKEAPPKDTKGFSYTRTPFGLYYLSYEGGGELPALLKGQFTSPKKAKEAADSYLEGKRNAASSS